MNNEIVVGLIGVLSTCITQVVAQFFIGKREVKSKKKENISTYLEPLNKQVSDTLERLTYNEERRKVKGENNSIRVIDGRVMKSIKNMGHVELKWFYEHGANLASTCYLLACLIAYSYHVKQHMTLVNFRNKHRKQILYYIERFHKILTNDYGIYFVTQYDIGQLMLVNNNGTELTSYNKFCKMVQNTDEYCCFVQLFNFIINIANGERREQHTDLLNLLTEFKQYLDTIILVN